MRIGAFLPFYATCCLNGHDIIARMLDAQGVRFRMKENAFVSVTDPTALQAAADCIDPRLIQERLDHWTFMLGPKFVWTRVNSGWKEGGIREIRAIRGFFLRRQQRRVVFEPVPNATVASAIRRCLDFASLHST